MSKFKVGDRVRVVSLSQSCHENFKVGSIYKIIEEDNFHETPSYRLDGSSYANYFKDEHLRLVPESLKTPKILNFYKTNDPYYSLIYAESPSEAFRYFDDEVCEVDDVERFFEEVYEVTIMNAVDEIAASPSEEGCDEETGLVEALRMVANIIEEGEPFTILIDQSLL